MKSQWELEDDVVDWGSLRHLSSSGTAALVRGLYKSRDLDHFASCQQTLLYQLMFLVNPFREFNSGNSLRLH